MQLVWLPQASDDLVEARRFIARDDPTAAAKVVLRIVRAVERLATLPEIGRPGRASGTRELVVPGLPYIVPYRRRDEVIEILRVYHTSRRWPDHL
jgi:addiction module RelE/StbE family toxin